MTQLPAPVPARGVPRGARARAAAAGRLRRRARLPAARPGAAAALRGAVRPHLRRGGPPRARLARPARRPRPHRAARAGVRAGRAPALRRAPRRRPGRVRAQAVRDPPPGRAGGRGGRRARGASSRSSACPRSGSCTRASCARPSSAAYYPDLRDPRFESALALVHSRFSTNTLGTWDLAHPFNLLAHNGEINTVRGNANWLAAREPQLRSELLGDDLQKLYPIVEERWSDSAKLDAAVELLVLGGRSLAARADHARAAGLDRSRARPGRRAVRAFYEYYALPGRAVGRPGGDRSRATASRSSPRSTATACARPASCAPATAWSWSRPRSGVLDIDPADVVEHGRVGPGRLLVLDTASGAPDRRRASSSGASPARRPYGSLARPSTASALDLAAAREARAAAGAERDRAAGARSATPRRSSS